MALTRSLVIVLLAGLALVLNGCATQGPDPAPQVSAGATDAPEKGAITKTTVPPVTFFHREYELPAAKIQDRIQPIAEEVALAAVRRARLEIVGPLTLVLPDFRDYGEGDLTVAFGYPVRGHGSRLQHYAIQRKDRFHCLSAVFDRESEEASRLWRKLYETAAQRGLEPSKENRVVIREQGDGYQTVFQLGLKPSNSG